LTHALPRQPHPTGSTATASLPKTPVTRFPGPIVGASARPPPRAPWPPPRGAVVWPASCPAAPAPPCRRACVVTSATDTSTSTPAGMIERLLVIAASLARRATSWFEIWSVHLKRTLRQFHDLLHPQHQFRERRMNILCGGAAGLS